MSDMMSRSSLAALFGQPHLNASFAIGFLILFAFIGTFTYVNFVLTSGAIGLSPMQLGFVYFVFVPSIILTPMAGLAARRFGTRRTIIAALAIAVMGLPALLLPDLMPVLAGLTLVAAGTFLAQATATGYVSRSAGNLRGQAGGIYLASYYGGGLAGSVILGQIFDHAGWPATIAVLILVLAAGCALATFLAEPKAQ
jgi:predicted MFS family arabinose efflux permease